MLNVGVADSDTENIKHIFIQIIFEPLIGKNNKLG